MRILIVGGGVAGLTLAARLSQQDREVVVVERATAPDEGYAIGLYPLGSCVLHGLGTYDELLARGQVVDRYELAGHRGQPLQSLDMSVLTAEAGPMVMIGRAGLLDILEGSCDRADLRRGVTVTSLAHAEDAVDVELDDGTSDRFDLVVACDGIASATRQLVFGEPDGFDAGWTLVTWWARADRFDPTVVREWWGRGWFFGAYPAPGRVMCAAGGPADQWTASAKPDAGAVAAGLRPLSDHDPAVTGAIEGIEESYRWPMRDVRARRWSHGRVALCGDAAVAFLPTAGVGASNAMRGAAALADELSRADATTVPRALDLYERRCRSIVERNQTDSRRLSRAMFVRNPALARGRDLFARLYPAERMLAQIIASTRAPF